MVLLIRFMLPLAFSVGVGYFFVKYLKRDRKFIKKENLTTADGVITGIINYKIDFFIPVYRYEYSFLVGDITYTGFYYQNSSDFKKQGQIAVNQKVLYDKDDPSSNKLEIDNGLLDNKKAVLVGVLLVLIILLKFLSY